MTKTLPVDVCLCFSPKELLEELVSAMKRIKEEKETNGREQLPTPMVWGGIGLGKSVLIRDATDKIYGEDAIYVDWRLSTCLTGEMEIATSNGVKPIKEIQIGEKILGFENGQLKEAIILNKFELMARELIYIRTENGTISCTPDHKFLTDGGWRLAKQLYPNQSLYLLDSYGMEKVYSRREAIGKRKIQGTRTKEIGTYTGKTFFRGNRLSSEIRCVVFPEGDVSGLRIQDREVIQGGNWVHRRNNRWRGHYNYWAETFEEGPPCGLLSNNSDFKHRFRPLGLAEGQADDSDFGAKKEKVFSLEGLLFMPDEGFQNCTFVKSNRTSFDCEEKAVPIGPRVPSIERQEREKGAFFREGDKDILDGKKAELKKVKILGIDRKNTERRVFDLATSTKNYFVKGILCHNCEPTDLLGIPKIENGTTIFCPPSKFPTIGKGVLHFDEINLAPLAVQHSAYQLLLDGKLGYYTLPKTFQIIASGNEKEHRAGVYDIPAPLMNRMIHLKLVEPKTEYGNLANWREDWVDWAVRHGIDTRVTTYIYQHPAKLYDFDPRKVERSFASPRSWEFTSVRIKGLKDLERLQKACNSTIGAKMTQDFIAFLKIGQEFNVENIFRHPRQFKTTDYEVDVQFFLTSAITDYVGIAYDKLKVEEKKRELLDTFCYLMSQFTEEFQVLMCVEPNSTLLTTPKGRRLLSDLEIGDKILGLNGNIPLWTEIEKIYSQTKDELITIGLDGLEITTSPEHPIYTSEGWINAKYINKDTEILVRNENGNRRNNPEDKRELSLCEWERVSKEATNSLWNSSILEKEIRFEKDLQISLGEAENRVGERGFNLLGGINRRRGLNLFSGQAKADLSYGRNFQYRFGLDEMVRDEVQGEKKMQTGASKQRLEDLLSIDHYRDGKNILVAKRFISLSQGEENGSKVSSSIYRAEKPRYGSISKYIRRKNYSKTSQVSKFSFRPVKTLNRRRNKTELWDITTGTNNFFANDILVHNCRLVYGFKDVYEALLQKDSPLTKYVTNRLFPLLFAKVG